MSKISPAQVTQTQRLNRMETAMLVFRTITCIVIVVMIVLVVTKVSAFAGAIAAVFSIAIVFYLLSSCCDPPCQYLASGRHDEQSLQQYVDTIKRASPTLTVKIACYHTVTTGSGKSRRTKRVYTHRASMELGNISSFTDITPDFTPKFHTTRVTCSKTFAFDTPARQQAYEKMRDDFYRTNTSDVSQDKTEEFNIPNYVDEGLFPTDYHYQAPPQHYTPAPAPKTPPRQHLPRIFNLAGYLVSLICLWNPLFAVLFYCFTGKMDITFHKIIQQDPHTCRGSGGKHASSGAPTTAVVHPDSSAGQRVPYGPPTVDYSHQPAGTHSYNPMYVVPISSAGPTPAPLGTSPAAANGNVFAV